MAEAPFEVTPLAHRRVAPRSPLRWSVAAAWLLAAVAALALIVRTHTLLETPLAVFPAYYGAAKLIERGEKVANFYDDSWFLQSTAEFSPERVDIYNANTPLMAAFFLPLTRLSYDDARRLTSALGFVAVTIAAYLMAIALGLEGVWRAAAFAAVYAAPMTLANLAFAQVYPFVLLLLVFAWLAWRKRAETTAGAFVGIALAFKTAGALLLLLLLIKRSWRALICVAAVIALLAAMTFPFVGIDGWTAYFDYALRLGNSSSVSRFWSIAGMSRSFFVYDAQWNPAPYFDAPAFAGVIEALLSIAIVAASARAALATDDRDLTFALFTLDSLVLMPLTASSHLCVAFLPALVVLAKLRHRMTSPLGIWFAAAAVLSFAPGVERLASVAEWGGPVFRFPRLYGLLILMLVVVRLAREHALPIARPHAV